MVFVTVSDALIAWFRQRRGSEGRYTPTSRPKPIARWVLNRARLPHPSFWVRRSLIGRRKNDPFGLIFAGDGLHHRGTIQSRLRLLLSLEHKRTR